MRLAPELIDEIVAHARETAPEECCGVVTGRDGEALAVERAENEFAHRMRYRISADEMFRIYKLADGRGEEMLAFYHSHPRSEAYPSQTDINEASGLPESVHLICSLADPDAPSVRAFEIRANEVQEVPLDGG
ncbi:MAG: Mov34/MPN/PAD-1 family protein [Solirubrobacterales bacterium]